MNLSQFNRSLLSTLLLCAAMEVYAEQIFETIEATDRVIRKGTYYSNLDRLDCNNHEIVITSTCVANDDFNSDPYCFQQNVAFVNIGSRKSRSASFYYEEDRQKYIYGVSCIKSENKYYVELQSSNLGNCTKCEWSDYFSQQGSYIGSDNGKHAKTNFRKKIISIIEAKKIRKGISTQKIHMTTISRM
jgi:hypothetical protein